MNAQEAKSFAQRVEIAKASDPDGDLAVMARAYLAADDHAELMRAENERLREAMLEAINVDATTEYREPFYRIKGILRRSLEATYQQREKVTPETKA